MATILQMKKNREAKLFFFFFKVVCTIVKRLSHHLKRQKNSNIY